MSTTSSKTSEGREGPYLVVILGPTAIGKSGIAADCAHRFDSALINADSRQFYKEMRIGTARPTLREQKGVPHYLFGDRSIQEPINAADFEREGIQLLRSLFQDHEILFLVGGSGLFIDALIRGLDEELPPPDPLIRKDLERTFELEGAHPLLEELKERDPSHYERVDRQNHRRVIRALEVIRKTERPFSSFRQGKAKERPFTPIKVGLWTERNELHRRIGQRIERMMEEGLLGEVRELLPYRDQRTLCTVGYQELFPYIDGTIDLETSKERIARNTRRYAKRQMTWFRRDPDIAWFRPEEKEGIITLIERRTGLKALPGPAPSDI